MQVFLSYHTPDREIATSLKNAIEGNRPGTDVFLDQSHLRLGHFWQDALYKAIDDTDAFLLLLSNKVGDWQKAEFREANDKKQKNPESFLLLPIIIADPNLGPVPNLHGLSQLHWIECNEPSAPEPMAKIAEALSGRVTPKPIEPWRRFNPYRGLLALEEEDTEFFYGREEITTDILKAMIERPDKMITLIGNSGVGKSSLVQAGVIGALKRRRWPLDEHNWPENDLGDPRNWAYLTMRPGNDPIKNLTAAFTTLWNFAATDPNKYARTDEWAIRLKSGGQLSDLIEATDGRFGEIDQIAPERILLYIDQGEELYSSSSADEIKKFSTIIAEALGDPRLLLMTSQRADYYGHLQANEILFNHAYKIDVTPLTSDQLTQVLAEPARKLGAKFESDELVGKIVNGSTDQPGALPLLADMMTDLWKRMQKRKDGVLRLSEQKKIIKLSDALTTRADKFLEKNEDKTDLIKRLFTLKLINVPAMGAPVRMRALKSDCEAEWQVVETLATSKWRLLVISEENGEPCTEVAHEVLLTEWRKLSDWIAGETKFLNWKNQLSHFYKRHEVLVESAKTKNVQMAKDHALESMGQHKLDELPKLALLHGLDLTEATGWLKKRAGDIKQSEQNYIKHSIEYAEKKENELNEMERRLERGEDKYSAYKVEKPDGQFAIPSPDKFAEIDDLAEIETDMSDILERTIPGGEFIKFNMLKAIVLRAESVAKIMRPGRLTMGTGFLIKGSDINAQYGDQLLLLTVAHILWDDNWDPKMTPMQRGIAPDALNPKDAIVTFGNESLDDQAGFYNCEDVALWQSPSHLHDVCLIALKEDVSHLTPIPVSHPSERPVPENTDEEGSGTPIAIIGHTGEKSVSVSGIGSIENTNGVIVDIGPRHPDPTAPIYMHYRTPTLGGMSGAPVLNTDNWNLIGIHHASAMEGEGLNKLNGKPGVNFASEGIDIQSIRRAIKKDLADSRWWKFGK